MAFRRADQNQNGLLTRAELIKSLRQDVKLQQFLHLPSRITTSDGESQAAFERVFQAMDISGDRQVDLSEFRSFCVRISRAFPDATERSSRSVDTTQTHTVPQLPFRTVDSIGPHVQVFSPSPPVLSVLSLPSVSLGPPPLVGSSGSHQYLTAATLREEFENESTTPLPAGIDADPAMTLQRVNSELYAVQSKMLNSPRAERKALKEESLLLDEKSRELTTIMLEKRDEKPTGEQGEGGIDREQEVPSNTRCERPFDAAQGDVPVNLDEDGPAIDLVTEALKRRDKSSALITRALAEGPERVWAQEQRGPPLVERDGWMAGALCSPPKPLHFGVGKRDSLSNLESDMENLISGRVKYHSPSKEDSRSWDRGIQVTDRMPLAPVSQVGERVGVQEHTRHSVREEARRDMQDRTIVPQRQVFDRQHRGQVIQPDTMHEEYGSRAASGAALQPTPLNSKLHQDATYFPAKRMQEEPEPNMHYHSTSCLEEGRGSLQHASEVLVDGRLFKDEAIKEELALIDLQASQLRDEYQEKQTRSQVDTHRKAETRDIEMVGEPRKTLTQTASALQEELRHVTSEFRKKQSEPIEGATPEMNRAFINQNMDEIKSLKFELELMKSAMSVKNDRIANEINTFHLPDLDGLELERLYEKGRLHWNTRATICCFKPWKACGHLKYLFELAILHYNEQRYENAVTRWAIQTYATCRQALNKAKADEHYFKVGSAESFYVWKRMGRVWAKEESKIMDEEAIVQWESMNRARGVARLLTNAVQGQGFLPFDSCFIDITTPTCS